MPFDFTTAMLQATVAVAQSQSGPGVIGTGVLVSDRGRTARRAWSW